MDWTMRGEALPLGDPLVRTAQKTPGAIALAFPEETYTYQDLFDRAERGAGRWREAGRQRRSPSPELFRVCAGDVRRNGPHRRDFEGRQKDMLKVGGENVPAVDVENYPCTHPAVLSAEVAALPDSTLDEVPVAIVELLAGISTTERELIDFCKGHLATFKVPRAIRLVAAGEWPMPASKINKVALREAAKGLFSLSATGEPSRNV
jgi:acyl-CoA synthetase (AMP-forming)/AMP-acid ligase II